jgi:eukaryotic-like serine/threonine-protein kinase
MRIGDVLAERFVLKERVGSGGMGTVYRAADRETGLPAAVKVLRDQHGDDARRFDREVRLLADLSHPRIVRHVAHGMTDEGEPWLVMEWLSGEEA